MKHSLLIFIAVILLPIAAMAQDNQPKDKDWARTDGDWLKERNFLGRGIGGQNTMQLLVRFRADVIELDPEYVVILAGINDIARNNIEKAS